MGTSYLSKMAPSAKTHPSIEEIFRILAGIPENKLLKFKHKLNCIRQDRRSCQLLQAMILLTLRRETDARVSLDALGGDATAAHVYRSHRDGAKAGGANSLSPEQEAAVATTVAQIYSLLVDEQLCDPQARVEAYKVAIKTAQASNSVDGAKLDSLIEEAQRKCGLEFDFSVINNGFRPLRSVAGKLTVPATRSYSRPIRDVSVSPDPRPLRSTDTLDSLASHLEISQSPTVLLLTHSDHQPDISEPSKSPLAENGEGGDTLKLPASCSTESPASSSAQDDPKSSLLVSPDLRAAPPLEERVNHPVECTEPQTVKGGELQEPEGSAAPHLDDSSTLQPGSDTEQCTSPCIGASDSPAHNTSSRPFSLDSLPPPPPPPGTILTDPEYNKTEFFTFVVLHADEDEPIACRVKDRLNGLGVSNGATFSENFLIPGRCQFSCFQDALDNSAFTLLLLTENFKCRICAYQTSVALWDSFQRFLKTNSVIPFVPKENPIREMPLMLSTLVPLIENSSLFATKVKNTFTAHAIEAKRRGWRCMRKRQEQSENYLMAQMNMAGCPSQMPFPLPPMGFPGLQNASSGYVPETYLRPTFRAPEMPPAQQFQSQRIAFSLGPPSLTPGGSQPHLIIQNAQMVQIGDYNQMRVEGTMAALGTATGEEDGNPVLEGESAGERTEE